MKEIKCEGCLTEATPDRLDTGVTESGEVIYICPVCGHNMGEVTLDVEVTKTEKLVSKFKHPSSQLGYDPDAPRRDFEFNLHRDLDEGWSK